MEEYGQARAEVMVSVIQPAMPDRNPLEILTHPATPNLLRGWIPDYYDGTDEAEIVRESAIRLLEEKR